MLFNGYEGNPVDEIEDTGFDMKADTSNQLIVVTQHRYSGQWYGIIRYSDGRQSGIFGPFQSNQQAIQSLRHTLDNQSLMEPSQDHFSNLDFNDLAV